MLAIYWSLWIRKQRNACLFVCVRVCTSWMNLSAQLTQTNYNRVKKQNQIKPAKNKAAAAVKKHRIHHNNENNK